MILVVPLFLGMVCLAHADVLELLKGALAARWRGDFDSSIDLYGQVIASGELSSRDLAFVLRGRRIAHDLKGQIDNAMADFDAAIQLAADFGSANIDRGLVWIKCGEYDRQ